MIRLILLLLSLISLVNCSKLGDPKPPHAPEPELEIHVERFGLHYDGPWPARLDIYFADIKKCNEDGTCRAAQCIKGYDLNGQFRDIEVDQTLWDTLSDIRKEALIFHELGHCVMDLDHADLDEISFMLPELQLSEWYLVNRLELYLDLFGIEPLDTKMILSGRANEREKLIEDDLKR